MADKKLRGSWIRQLCSDGHGCLFWCKKQALEKKTGSEQGCFPTRSAAGIPLTCVRALRQASKNILYTMGNSGNYTSEDAQAGGLDHMTKLFIAIDAAIGIVSLAILAFVYARYFRKRKKKVMVYL